MNHSRTTQNKDSSQADRTKEGVLTFVLAGREPFEFAFQRCRGAGRADEAVNTLEMSGS